MSKKKSQGKKHRFKHAAPEMGAPVVSSSVATGAVTAQQTNREVAQKRPGQVVVGIRDFSYVGRDLRRIAVLAISLVALEVVLWYVFGHTGVGNSIYQMVQV